MDNINKVDEITLTYLVNRGAFAKYMHPIRESILKRQAKDRRFYRKRIVDTTKNLLVPKTDTDFPADLKRLFDAYCAACVDYYKGSDTCDILQEDYDGLASEEPADDCIQSNQETFTESNASLMRTIHNKELNCLERLVKRVSLKTSTVGPAIPLLKNVNLKDPILRVKGIIPK